jgi:hypothetical protein
VRASQANDEFFTTCICVADLSAMQMQRQKICNADAPGIKLMISYVEPCNVNAKKSAMQKHCRDTKLAFALHGST